MSEPERDDPPRSKTSAIKSEARRRSLQRSESSRSRSRRGSASRRGSHSPNSYAVSPDGRSLSSTGSAKRDSLLNIFNNRDTKELKNLRDEARIMNFKSANLSNEELECKYKLFCLPERSSSSVENLIDRNTLSLNEAIEKKIRALKLVNQMEKELQNIRERTKKCEKNLRSLKSLLGEFP